MSKTLQNISGLNVCARSKRKKVFGPQTEKWKMCKIEKFRLPYAEVLKEDSAAIKPGPLP